MAQPLTTFRRVLTVFAFVVFMALTGRGPARAEYEIPYVDNAATLAKVEFRGMWSINRGNNPSGYGGYSGPSPLEGYEAYAVGLDPTISDADKADKNGVVFFYDGSKWVQVPSPASSSTGLPNSPIVPLYEVNAITGQYNDGYGTPHPLFVAGSKGRISWTQSYHGRLNDVAGSWYYRRFIPIAWSNRNAAEARPFYAIDAAQGYKKQVLAGGRTDGTSPIIALGGWDGGMTILTPGAAVAAQRVTGLADPARENVTGIRFVDQDTAYIVTSTFEGNADRYDLNGRNCTNSAAQVGRIYRAKRTNAGFRTWDLLGTKNGVCFYGLAVGKRTESVAAGLPSLPAVIWAASSNGVFTFDEQNVAAGIQGPRAGTAGQFLYAISSVVDRQGQNQDLMVNGRMEYWADASTPDNWIHTDNPYGFNAGAVCGTNENDFSQYQRTPTNKALMVWPAKPFTNPGCTTQYTGIQTSGAIARIETAPFQGQTIRITGRYHVDFTARNAAPSDPTPDHAEGGVSIGCAGGYSQPGSSIPVNCSMRTRKFIHTYSKASANGGQLINNPTPGTGLTSSTTFNVTISRQDYETALWESGSSILVTPRRFDLQIRCEATYGARVWCDDIRVTEVIDPPVPARNEFYVVATGRNRAILSTKQGLADTGAFTAESQNQFLDPANRRFDYQAVFGSALQHVFVAGAGLDTTVPAAPVVTSDGPGTLLTRAPSTLVGYVWVGTADNSGATPAGTGVISTSCINNRVNNQTLCQRSSDSYGLAFDVNRVTDGIGDTGDIQGRAWFGKQIASGETADAEQINAGFCENNESVVNVPAGQNTYNIVSVCDQLAHRCKINRNVGTTTLSNRSCLSDYDCYGRCTGDAGRICVSDHDCSITSGSNLNASVVSPVNLVRAPANFLQCSADSPQSCSTFGWLSFDAADFSAADTTPPVGTEAWGVRFNTLNRNHNQANAGDSAGAHELRGWARFKTLTTGAGICREGTGAEACDVDSDCIFGGGALDLGPCVANASHASGWVHFRSTTPVAPTPKVLNIEGQGNVNYLVSCQDCYGNGLGNMNCAFCNSANRAACTPSSGAGISRCSYFCDNTAPGTYRECTSDAQCTTGGHCKPLGVCSGDNATSCQEDNECSAVGGTCTFGAFCRTTNAQCVQYGVNVSLQTGAYFGYAWSEDFGWLDFRGVGRAGSRFIQTRLGSIYAGGVVGDANLSQPQGVNNCNATFLIRAGGDIASNWCSALGDSAKLPNTGGLALPSTANQFTNALGRIDLAGIISETSSGSGQNKYGSPLVNLTLNAGNEIANDLKAEMGADNVLGGRVYKVSGCPSNACEINEALTIANGDIANAAAGNGAGILYVDGDLTISQPLAYDVTRQATDPREIASLTVIVTGKLEIATGVRNLVGAYYVMGADGISTITTRAGAETNQLTVRGLMIAKEFTFGRRFAGTVENPAPSELIIYDGRLQTNPMPGLVDFSRILPAQVSQP